MRLSPRSLLLLIALLVGAQLSLAAHVHAPDADAGELEHCLVCPLHAVDSKLHATQAAPLLLSGSDPAAFSEPWLAATPVRAARPSIRDPPPLY